MPHPTSKRIVGMDERNTVSVLMESNRYPKTCECMAASDGMTAAMNRLRIPKSIVPSLSAAVFRDGSGNVPRTKWERLWPSMPSPETTEDTLSEGKIGRAHV